MNEPEKTFLSRAWIEISRDALEHRSSDVHICAPCCPPAVI